MTKRILFIFGFVLAVTVGLSLSHSPMLQAESATHETTYVFHDLGMTTNEARQEVAKILDQMIGISRVEISSTKDQVKMTIDQDTMKPEWAAKTLNAAGYAPKNFIRVKGQ